MPVTKRKLVPHHSLSPTQFVVHSDIVTEKVHDILDGEVPEVEVTSYENGEYEIVDGHHTAAAYAALGRRVPIVTSTAPKERGEPQYGWHDLHHVDDENPTVDHPAVGTTGWMY
jgi:hypothetical protein